MRIRRGCGGEIARYEEFDVEFEEGDSVLDGLVRLRATLAPNLAFPYSCFNANVCKECVMQINGIIDYACVAKLKVGTTQLDPVPDQHVLRDLVVCTWERDRKGVTLRRQMRFIGNRDISTNV